MRLDTSEVYAVHEAIEARRMGLSGDKQIIYELALERLQEIHDHSETQLIDMNARKITCQACGLVQSMDPPK
jgi:hypothetical protein